MYVCTYIYIYIYIYVHRERERDYAPAGAWHFAALRPDALGVARVLRTASMTKPKHKHKQEN